MTKIWRLLMATWNVCSVCQAPFNGSGSVCGINDRAHREARGG